ncbi:ferritin-like domain-containing protein [Tunturiibacter psychrotolerans]|uniref:ferritin-like domain-containing protein n=1 Tax=Tunturiibacter psychrotolerans TaxID=3069686 RepID=UPI003D1EDA08
MNGKSLVEPVKGLLPRRSFVTRAGLFGLSATAAAFLPGTPLLAQAPGVDNQSGDTAQEIFTAALIAEDLATTFYYNGLVGTVIMDPNLAGPGGTAKHVESTGNVGNVDYFRAALSEEIQHADLLRSLIAKTSSTTDPVQTFYFPTGTFDTLAAFIDVLNSLENTFIAAYLMATIEFAQMASDTRGGLVIERDANGNVYTARDLEYFAQVAASIMGVEAEHRVLGRVVMNQNPANNTNYERTDLLTAVYNGKRSAVVALTPFLAPGNGLTAYSLQTAVTNAGNVSMNVPGGPPEQPSYPAGH